MRRTEEMRQKALGIGKECVVIPHEKNGKLVVAIHYKGMTRYDARRLYYEQRILTTLFPHNFPAFHMVFPSQKEMAVGVSLRARINGAGGTAFSHTPGSGSPTSTEDPNKNDAFLEKEREYNAHRSQIRFPLKRATDGLEEMGLYFNVDDFVGNQIIGEDGGEYYVDSGGFVTPQSVPDVLRKMERFGYDAEAIHTVKECFDRLDALNQDAIEPMKGAA